MRRKGRVVLLATASLTATTGAFLCLFWLIAEIRAHLARQELETALSAVNWKTEELQPLARTALSRPFQSKALNDGAIESLLVKAKLAEVENERALEEIIEVFLNLEARRGSTKMPILLARKQTERYLREIQLFREARAILQKANRDLKDALNEFGLLAQDFSDLLSLPAERPEDLVTYTQGVLADLPQIEGLPDGIPDAEKLSAWLQELGAKVTAVSPQDFSTRLESLRNSARNCTDQVASLRQAQDDRESALETARYRLEINKQSWRKLFALAILELTEPDEFSKLMFRIGILL